MTRAFSCYRENSVQRAAHSACVRDDSKVTMETRHFLSKDFSKVFKKKKDKNNEQSEILNKKFQK